MKLLGTRVNLIPVIAKADTLTQSDLFTFKQRVRPYLYLTLPYMQLNAIYRLETRRISAFVNQPLRQMMKLAQSMRISSRRPCPSR
jgi:hypothetical protein